MGDSYPPNDNLPLCAYINDGLYLLNMPSLWLAMTPICDILVK